MIETTINIHREILDMVNCAAKKTGFSRTEIVIILFKRIMGSNTNRSPFNTSVKYQDKDNHDNWHKFHIQLKEDDYEYLLDLRKLLKRSVSFILAYAVRKYIKEFIDGKLTDNYPFKNYIIAKEIVNDVICWKLFWGVPEDIEKILFSKA
ncbi:hypothetical protein ACFL20_01925 [Spirochaetota bacterium]